MNETVITILKNAGDGFKATPIPYEQWVAAANRCDEFSVEERKDRKGRILHVVRLKTDSRQCLSLTPYGLVLAQDPSENLVGVMFELAGLLDAKVYSERLKPYKSVDDWKKRTRNYREGRLARKRQYARTWYRRKSFWVIVAAIIGFLLGIL